MTTPQVALVTGSAQGIGAAIARRLRADGIDVVLLDILDTVRDTARELGALGAIQLDIRDTAALQQAVRGIPGENGGLDILVNCAGTCSRASFEAITPDERQRDLDTNLGAAVFAAQAAVFPHMRAQGSGRIVNIASVSGKTGGIGPVYRDGSGGRSGVAYAAAKAGTINATRWIAKQVGAWGITCNAVAPGPIATPMAAGGDYGVDSLPIPRMGTGDEVAGAVAYLVGPDAGYTTGVCMHVDGGTVLA